MANGSLLNNGVGVQGIYDMQSIRAQILFGLLIPKAWQTSNEDVNPFILYTQPSPPPFLTSPHPSTPQTHPNPANPHAQPARKQRPRLPQKSLVRMGFRLRRRLLRRLLQQPSLLTLQRSRRSLPLPKVQTLPSLPRRRRSRRSLLPLQSHFPPRQHQHHRRRTMGRCHARRFSDQCRVGVCA